MLKGGYILLLSLDAPVEVLYGKRSCHLKPGLYVYIGSAMNGLHRRIARHCKKRKKVFWHIDKLTCFSKVRVLGALVMITNEQNIETQLARLALKYFTPVCPGFGCSDTSDITHLFRVTRGANLLDLCRDLKMYYLPCNKAYSRGDVEPCSEEIVRLFIQI